MKKLNNIAVSMILLTFLSGCNSYKTSWDCAKAKGIGCSSLEYADEIARKQILLNKGEKQKKNILIRHKENKFVEEEIY